MTDSNQKIEMLKKRIDFIDEKMKNLLVQKKEFEKQIKDIREQEILNAVRESGIEIETLTDDLALAKILRENNLTKNDILELITPTKPQQQKVQTNYISNGGNNDENA